MYSVSGWQDYVNKWGSLSTHKSWNKEVWNSPSSWGRTFTLCLKEPWEPTQVWQDLLCKNMGQRGTVTEEARAETQRETMTEEALSRDTGTERDMTEEAPGQRHWEREHGTYLGPTRSSFWPCHGRVSCGVASHQIGEIGSCQTKLLRSQEAWVTMGELRAFEAVLKLRWCLEQISLGASWERAGWLAGGAE